MFSRQTLHGLPKLAQEHSVETDGYNFGAERSMLKISKDQQMGFGFFNIEKMKRPNNCSGVIEQITFLLTQLPLSL